MYKKFLSVLVVTLLLLTVTINTTNVYADEPVYFNGATGVKYDGYTVSASGTEKYHHSNEIKKDGKWYFEETVNSFTGRFEFGIANWTPAAWEIVYYICEGNQFRRWKNGDTALKSVNIGLNKGDVLGFALDADNNNLEFFKNGVSIYKLNNAFTNFVKGGNGFATKTGTGGSSVSSYNVTYNFGQSDFKYAIPAGYKPFIEKPVTGVAVYPQSHTMDVGETVALDAQVTPTDAANKTIVWTSNDNTIATVDSNGVVTAVAVGQAVITAKSNNGISGVCNITVTEPTSVTSDCLAVYLEAGEKSRLCVTDDIADNLGFIWSSDDNSVATVNVEGVVTGVSAGICNITAQDSSGLKQTLAVRVVNTDPVVEPDPEIIKVNDNDENITYSGTWLPYSGDSRFYDGDQYYSNEVNAYAEFSFRGTAIRWIAATNSDNGKCDIYVDGVLEAQGLDLYSANIETQKVLFSKSGFSRGEHTIKIVITGEKNANATDCYVTVDAFEYEA